MPDLPVPLPADEGEARALVARFITASRAANTRRGYESDWRHFARWCEGRHRVALPADPLTVAAYLAELANEQRKLATIKRRSAAIAFVHRGAGHPNPSEHPGVRTTLEGIARELGSAPVKKAALTADLVAKAVRRIPTDVLGLRDRALLLIGFAAALRRSELVDLNVNDIARHPKGVVLTVRRGKTDQIGVGRSMAVPHGKRLCPVAALDAWIAAGQISDGPLFRPVRGLVGTKKLAAKQVARIVKKRCAAVGLDPNLFAGHSLRSGFLTSASDSGASLQAMATHVGHAKLDTTAGYVQVRDAFREHPGAKFL